MHGQYGPPAPADRHELVAEELAVLDGLDAVLAHREPQLLDPRAGDHQLGAVELEAHVGLIGLDHQRALGVLSRSTVATAETSRPSTAVRQKASQVVS